MIVPLTLTDLAPAAEERSLGRREGEAGAGVETETETGGDDTRSTGDILQKAVIQVTLINIEQLFFILKRVNNFQEYFFVMR